MFICALLVGIAFVVVGVNIAAARSVSMSFVHSFHRTFNDHSPARRCVPSLLLAVWLVVMMLVHYFFFFCWCEGSRIFSVLGI